MDFGDNPTFLVILFSKIVLKLLKISTLFETVSNNAKREIDWLTSNDYSGLRSACVCLKLGINKEKKNNLRIIIYNSFVWKMLFLLLLLVISQVITSAPMSELSIVMQHTIVLRLLGRQKVGRQRV